MRLEGKDDNETNFEEDVYLAVEINMDKNVWKFMGKKVASIEYDEESEVDCSGCAAPCCKGKATPTLTLTELISGGFKAKITPLPEALKDKAPLADSAVMVNVKEKCPYLDEDNMCKIWDNRPQSCRAYDCRNDKRTEVTKGSKYHKD